MDNGMTPETLLEIDAKYPTTKSGNARYREEMREYLERLESELSDGSRSSCQPSRRILRGEGMREIKFRAWDKEYKRMYPSSGSLAEIRGFRYPWGFQTGCHEIEIMQYIGLKDKNGVEIYEGDILEVHWNEHYPQQRGCVEFLGGQFICWVDLNGARGGVENEALKCSVVIGNIYENPELTESNTATEPSEHSRVSQSDKRTL